MLVFRCREISVYKRECCCVDCLSPLHPNKPVRQHSETRLADRHYRRWFGRGSLPALQIAISTTHTDSTAITPRANEPRLLTAADCNVAYYHRRTLLSCCHSTTSRVIVPLVYPGKCSALQSSLHLAMHYKKLFCLTLR